MKKQVLIFGLLASGVIFFYSYIVFMLFGDWNNMTPKKMAVMEVFGYLRYLILIIAIFFAMKSVRKETLNINYMSIVKIGLMVSIIISFFIGIGEWIYAVINPDFFDKYSEITIKGLQEEGASPERIAEHYTALEQFGWMRNPYLSALFYFFQTFIIGAIVSFLFGIFLRSKNTATPAQA
jgi:hypothetical protein